MKILVIGSDGYLGRALVPYLKSLGHEVRGADNQLRERNVMLVGSDTLIPISGHSTYLDVTDTGELLSLLKEFSPEAVVHFAEQPSAPFSMRSSKDAMDTQRNNIIGTMSLIWAIRETNPDIHIVKLGTMGVYGTPEADIPESDGPIAYDPGSFYHISKAADSINLRKSSQWWGLKVSDLHQGIVYGYVEGTRFDYDSYFGTVLNRFLAQSLIGHPLTVYGEGGQTRGFINIKDTLRCIELAILNPPSGYRVFNQLTETFSVMEIADMVSQLTKVPILRVENPRMEKEEHRYSVKHDKLLGLGLVPRRMRDELPGIWESLQPYRSRVNPDVVAPKTKWR